MDDSRAMLPLHQGMDADAAARQSFGKACLVPLTVSMVLICGYAALILIPYPGLRAYGIPGLLHIRPNSTSHVSTHVSVDAFLCPREMICSEGLVQLLLIATARISAYALYVVFALALVTKCYCLVLWLSGSALAIYIPFKWTHEMHRLTGIIFVVCSLIHTVAHVIRWGLRGGGSYISRMLLHPAGLSGCVAVFFSLVAILPMWWHEWAKKLKLTFEIRHTMHLLVVCMGFALLWHHLHLIIFCLASFGLWAADRSFLFFFRTIRVEDVCPSRASLMAVCRCAGQTRLVSNTTRDNTCV